MSLKEIKLSVKYGHKHQKLINLHSWCISELYWSFLKNYKTGNIQKCIVLLDEEINKADENWAGIKSTKMNFDFESYLTKDRFEKKLQLLKVLHAGMLKIAKSENWEIDPLLDAYNSCIKAKIEYKFEVGKRKWSPDRKRKFVLYCFWDIDKFEVYWILFDKNENEISRELLLQKLPYDGEFIYYIDWKWKDNSTIILKDKQLQNKIFREIYISNHGEIKNSPEETPPPEFLKN